MSHVGYLRHHALLADRREQKRKKEHMSQFATPSAPSGGITWANHKNALVLVEPVSFEVGIQTSFGAADAVKATVHVIEGTGAPATYEDTLIFPKLLVSQTKGMVGQKVLGRLGQGSAKPGQSAPWLLNEATADDISKAEAWVAQNAKPAVASAQAPF